VVYRGVWVGTDVAIKQLLHDDMTEEQVEAFLKEIYIMRCDLSPPPFSFFFIYLSLYVSVYRRAKRLAVSCGTRTLSSSSERAFNSPASAPLSFLSPLSSSPCILCSLLCL
jgi:hypothetical protein